MNGVTIAEHSGLPTRLQEYEFSIWNFGRTAPPYGTSLLILSEWPHTITITTDLAPRTAPSETDRQRLGLGQLGPSAG